MAAPVQRSAALLHVTAPSSTLWKIDAKTVRVTLTGDDKMIMDETAEENGVVFTNPGHDLQFTGHVLSGQTPAKKGDVITLTWGSAGSITGSKEYVCMDAQQGGFGEVVTQDITLHYKDSANYTP